MRAWWSFSFREIVVIGVGVGGDVEREITPSLQFLWETIADNADITRCFEDFRSVKHEVMKDPFSRVVPYSHEHPRDGFRSPVLIQVTGLSLLGCEHNER